jgi:hypothetical protein
MDMLDVEFEWFDPLPDVDFHGLKSLCRQLFDTDAQFFDLSALVDLILSQPLLGSTVKVDGKESDPFAFLTVLNLHEHKVSSEGCCRVEYADLFRTNPSSKHSPNIYNPNHPATLRWQDCQISFQHPQIHKLD